MPPVLMTLLIVILIAMVAIWLIRQIPFPAGLQIVQTILIVIVVVIGLTKILALW